MATEHFGGFGKCNILPGDVDESIPSIPDGGCRLIITSPPYNIGKEYEKKADLDSYLSWQKNLIAKLLPKLSDNGSIVWQVGNFVNSGEIVPLDICFYPLFKSLGLKLRNRLIWHFEHGLHCKNRFSGRYETALWFTKSDDYVFNLDPVRVPAKYPGKLHFKGAKKGEPSCNPAGKNPSDYWGLISEEFDCGILEIPNVKANHPEKTEHPCQFPVELIERFILALTNSGDTILDPFAGSGSTGIAAIKHNRDAILCELNNNYVEITKKRLSLFYSGQLKLRPLGKPVYKPTGNEKISQIPASWKQGDLCK